MPIPIDSSANRSDSLVSESMPNVHSSGLAITMSSMFLYKYLLMNVWLYYYVSWEHANDVDVFIINAVLN